MESSHHEARADQSTTVPDLLLQCLSAYPILESIVEHSHCCDLMSLITSCKTFYVVTRPFLIRDVGSLDSQDDSGASSASSLTEMGSGNPHNVIPRGFARLIVEPKLLRRACRGPGTGTFNCFGCGLGMCMDCVPEIDEIDAGPKDNKIVLDSTRSGPYCHITTFGQACFGASICRGIPSQCRLACAQVCSLCYASRLFKALYTLNISLTDSASRQDLDLHVIQELKAIHNRIPSNTISRAAVSVCYRSLCANIAAQSAIPFGGTLCAVCQRVPETMTLYEQRYSRRGLATHIRCYGSSAEKKSPGDPEFKWEKGKPWCSICFRQEEYIKSVEDNKAFMMEICYSCKEVCGPEDWLDRLL